MKIPGRVELPLVIGGHVFRHSVLVGDIDTKGILGDDFLVDDRANLAVWKQEFSLGGIEIPFFQEKYVSFCCRAAVSKTVVVELSGEMIIPGKIVGPFQGTGVVEPTLLFQEKKSGITLAKTLVSNPRLSPSGL